MTTPKRQHFRHRTAVNAMVRVRGSFTWLRCLVHNLSKGGILLEVDNANVIAVGDRVEIEFKTSDKHGRETQRRFTGTTVWRRGTRYGVQFKSKA
jgi:hypothetical protein